MKGSFWRDNIEAFAVAIAMALVIRHFCIEAFRIPTGSMMPTLLGDRGPDGSTRFGDRILVDKYVYLWRDPRRFEVAVFQYPLNRNKNFIKRIVGLPGEWMRIVDGDIWTSTDEGETKTWKIARKPAGVRNQLFFPYYPKPVENPKAFDGKRSWVAEGDWGIDEAEGRFSVHAGAQTAAIEFDRRVLPYDDVDDGYDYNLPYVGDVRVSFDIDVKKAGTLAVEITEHGRPYRLVLSRDESYIEHGKGGRRHALEFKLNGEHTISFANVDDMLVIDLDGTMTEFEYAGDVPPSQKMFERDWRVHAIRIEASDCEAVLKELRIDRDVYYNADRVEREGPWEIPENHYFMLGDNTQHSKDSRAWNVAEAYHRNGEVLRWEINGTSNPAGKRPHGGPGAEVVVDVDINGHTRRFKSGEIERWEGKVAWPFVSRDHLIGRAFAVFWPIYLPPLSRNPTRVKLIR